MQIHWEKLILHFLCYQGNNKSLLTKKKDKKDTLHARILSKFIIMGRILYKAATKGDTDENGPIGNIGNRDKKFRTTVELIFNSYFKKLINFAKPFETIFVGDKNGFYLLYHEISYYELPAYYPK